MNRLDEIEARANAATEGPWEAGERCVFTLDGAPVVSDDVVHYERGMAGEGVCHGEDAEFIAHARADVPALVAALRAVLAIHTPVDRGRATACCTCEQWIESTDPEACIEWPCATVETIRQHIGDDL